MIDEQSLEILLKITIGMIERNPKRKTFVNARRFLPGARLRQICIQIMAGAKAKIILKPHNKISEID